MPKTTTNPPFNPNKSQTIQNPEDTTKTPTNP